MLTCAQRCHGSTPRYLDSNKKPIPRLIPYLPRSIQPLDSDDSEPAFTCFMTYLDSSVVSFASPMNFVPLPSGSRTYRRVIGVSKAARRFETSFPLDYTISFFSPLWELGMNHKHPFSSVQSSRANQKPTAERGSV